MIECVIFGGLLLDKYYEVETLPERGQDGFITNDFDCVGGCSVNMAATFNNLGGNAHIVSYVGCDEAGTTIIKYIKEKEFSTRYICQKEGSTGYSMVFLEPDGERTFLTKAGLELDFTREIIEDQLAGIQFAAVTGYFLLHSSAEIIIEALEEFHAAGGTILFDPSPMVQAIEEEIRQRVVNISTIVTPNNSEFAWIESFITDKHTVVLKKGAKGGTVYHKGTSFDYEAEKVPVVDTTGAGDSFAAGLLYGIADGRGIKKAITLAVRCAAITVGINRPHGFWKLEEQ